jgi:hypothetical protein|nr:hypothetical protein [Neorhizobium tomejilense]
MRLQFTSEKRPVNLSKRLRSFLESVGVMRSMSSCREAIAVAAGYRNWNELLKVVRTTFSPSVDGEGSSTPGSETAFANKLATHLDIPAAVALGAVASIRPYEARRLSEISDDHISLLAANICATGFPITDISDADYAGFMMVKPARTVYSEQMRRNVDISKFTYRLYVSSDGSTISDKNPRNLRRTLHGDDDFTRIMSLAGLANLPITPPSVNRDAPGFDIVYKTLRRLDRKVLILMKCAGSFDCWAYMDAFSLPKASPLFDLSVRYPALAAQFTCGSRWDGVTIKSGEAPARRDDVSRALSSDPVSAFADSVDHRQKHLWPSISVSPERVRRVAEWYLSIHPGDEYAVEPNAAAFMCHLPDEFAPRTTQEMKNLVHFVDRHLHVFEPDGMCVLPTSFASGFVSRVNADWSRVRELSEVSYIAPHPAIGSVVLGVAARESGYDMTAADFEDINGSDNEVRYDVGHLLAKDAGLSFFQVADGLKSIEDDKEPIEKRMEMANRDFAIEEDREYELYRTLGFIHPKHAHRSASEILNFIGYDIHDVIATYERPPQRLDATRSPAV